MILESYFPQIDEAKTATTMRKELELFKINLGTEFGNLADALPGFENIFLQGSVAQQKTFVARLKFYNEIFSSGMDPETDLVDLKFVWSILKKFKMCPPADLIGKLDVSNYIEIRDNRGVQIFGNFNFLKVLSYSVEELFWYSWDELFSRDEKITQLIMQEFIKSVTTATQPFDPNISEHTCWETRSRGKHSAKVKMLMFSPIFGENQTISYMLATSKIKVGSAVNQ